MSMNLDTQERREAVALLVLPVAGRKTASVLACAGLVLLLGGLVLVMGSGYVFGRFLHSYLTSVGFVTSVSVGALFFVALQHACRAGWSVAIRRVAELMGANIITCSALFVPLLVVLAATDAGPYDWATGSAAELHGLEQKRAYLNVPFFLLRTLLYLGVWSWLAVFFLSRSWKQDKVADKEITLRMERASYFALIVLGVTVTFASFDWFMSLSPEWYSTIYGVYFFSGSMVGSLSGMIVALVVLQSLGYLKRAVRADHYHDLGKLLFGFVIFWGYIAFSQYMLIWYANIPEETSWYLVRQRGTWVVLSLALLVGHLAVPFFGLLPRSAKRSKPALLFWSGWLLLFHWLDMYYLVMPQADGHGVAAAIGDVLCLAGTATIFAAGFIALAAGRSLLALNDPRLEESLRFESVY